MALGVLKEATFAAARFTARAAARAMRDPSGFDGISFGAGCLLALACVGRCVFKCRRCCQRRRQTSGYVKAAVTDELFADDSSEDDEFLYGISEPEPKDKAPTRQAADDDEDDEDVEAVMSLGGAKPVAKPVAKPAPVKPKAKAAAKSTAKTAAKAKGSTKAAPPAVAPAADDDVFDTFLPSQESQAQGLEGGVADGAQGPGENEATVPPAEAGGGATPGGSGSIFVL